MRTKKENELIRELKNLWIEEGGKELEEWRKIDWIASRLREKTTEVLRLFRNNRIPIPREFIIEEVDDIKNLNMKIIFKRIDFLANELIEERKKGDKIRDEFNEYKEKF